MKGQSYDDMKPKRLGYHGSQGGFQHLRGGAYRYNKKFEHQNNTTKQMATVNELNIPETDNINKEKDKNTVEE